MAKSLPKSTFPGIFAIVVISVLIVGAAQQSAAEKNMSIPDWVKNNAKWWADGQIAESDFISAIQYLINEGVIRITPQIAEVVAATTSLTDNERAQSFAVHFTLETGEVATFYTFERFAHFSQSIPETVSGSPSANYYGAPQFELGGLPSEDKMKYYLLIQKYIDPKASTLKPFDVSVDIVLGNGKVIQTWEYRDCQPSGFWVYLEQRKDIYTFSGKDESEIRELGDFKCNGFDLVIP